MSCLALFLGVSAQAAKPNGDVDEFLDQRTGASVTIVRQPLTFALERTTLAAHSRDYVSLSALEVDRSGQAHLYMLGYFWSTIDRRTGATGPNPTDTSILVFADGRPIRLTPILPLPKDLEANPQLLAPETARYEEAAYQVTWEQLRFISNSKVLKLQIVADKEDDDAEAETYEIWTDARRALGRFVARIGPGG